jgi:hypothetical protein
MALFFHQEVTCQKFIFLLFKNILKSCSYERTEMITFKGSHFVAKILKAYIRFIALETLHYPSGFPRGWFS